MKAILVITLLLSLFLAAALFGYSITRKDRSTTIYFTILVLAGAIYSFGYILELTAPDLSALVVALKVENIGIPLLAPFFLLLVLGICDYRKLRAWMAILAYVYSASMTICVLFNELHHLYYTSVVYSSAHHWAYADLGKGPLYILNQGVVIACMFAAYSILFISFKKWSTKNRKQVVLIIWGTALTFLANVANFSQLLPNGLDATPFACVLTLLLFSISIFRYKLFDIIPIATDTAIRTMDDALIVLDNDWGYMFSNDAAEHLFPGLASIRSNDPITLVDGWPEALGTMHRSGLVNFQLTCEDGCVNSYRASISPVGKELSPIGWSLVIRDTTEMTQLMKQLEILATTDSLTGIFNRRYFIQMVERELELAKRHPCDMCMVMFDLDKFKSINDTYGHLVGDYVLKSVVNIVKSGLRPYDILARYGGEEFMVFAMNMDEKDGVNMAWRLCKAISEADIVYQGTQITVSASFGVTQMSAYNTINEATAAVDIALYAAKSSGRNCVRTKRVTSVIKETGIILRCNSHGHPSQQPNAFFL